MRREEEDSRVCIVALTLLPELLRPGPQLLDELRRAPDERLQGRRKGRVS